MRNYKTMSKQEVYDRVKNRLASLEQQHIDKLASAPDAPDNEDSKKEYERQLAKITADLRAAEAIFIEAEGALPAKDKT